VTAVADVSGKTRASELLLSAGRAEQVEVVAAFLDAEGWPTYAEIVRGFAEREDMLTYCGWEIDRYRKPDKGFYAYAPSYDGLTPSDTQCAPRLDELCDLIDGVIEERQRRAA
jgi:hypothetical protein